MKTIFVLFLALTSVAFGNDANNIEMGGDIEVAGPASTGKPLVVVLPDAYQQALAKGRRVGAKNVVAIDLLVGTTTGARAEGFLWNNDGKAVALEVVAGEGFTRAGWAPANRAGSTSQRP